MTLSRNFNEIKQDEMRYLFYSAKAAEQYGSCFGEITDPKTGEKTKVNYTVNTRDPQASEYLWDDKVPVGKGRASQIKYTGGDALHERIMMEEDMSLRTHLQRLRR